MKILVVEDDENTATLLSEALTAHHYLVNATNNGETGLELAKSYDYDLILLDLMLPGLDGMGLCRQLRSQGSQMPILMLTAKDNTHDRIMGLQAGADDYVAKPFDVSELVARIQALLRRGRETLSSVLVWEDLRLDLSVNEVTYANQLVHLTPKEYALLELFLRNPRRIFSRSALLDNVWSFNEFPSELAVNTQIKGLRQKLKAVGMKTPLIETVYGMGYRLKPIPGEKAETPPHPESDVMAAVAKVWHETQAQREGQMELFEKLAAQLLCGSCDPILHQNVKLEVHRLVGSLGTFGLPEGSEVARRIEQLLQSTPVLDIFAAEQMSEWVQTLKQIIRQHPHTLESDGMKMDAAQPDSKERLASPTCLLITSATESATLQAIHTTAIALGLQVEHIAVLPTFSDSIEAHLPAVHLPALILLDLDISEEIEAGLALLATLGKDHPDIPVVVLSQHNQLSLRVEVAQLGGRIFLTKPAPCDRLFKALSEVLLQPTKVAGKVMVVDDDPQILAILSAVLEPWGLQVITLDNPEKFWEFLETVEPDLLILDIEMPNFSGFDLCQAVRNDLRWDKIPILFLSAHNDPLTIQKVFGVGADDYASKPIVQAELIARILNRLDRSQLRRELAETRGCSS